jgi:uncharacterized membrane protein
MDDETFRPAWKDNLDLWGLLVMVAGTAATIYLFPIPLLRILSGLFSLFFAPGYVLLAALFPTKQKLNLMQRVAGSFGLSITATGIMMLFLGYTIGITLFNSLIITSAWVIALVVIAWYRRAALPPGQRYRATWYFNLPAWRERPTVHKWLTLCQLVALVLLLLAAGRLLWVSAQAQPQFSEFYLLDSNGKIGDYTERAEPGSVVTNTVGIVNHEKRLMHYDIAYQVNDGVENDPISTVLQPGEQWESALAIRLPDLPAVNKVTIILRESESHETIHSLHLWIETEPTLK